MTDNGKIKLVGIALGIAFFVCLGLLFSIGANTSQPDSTTGTIPESTVAPALQLEKAFAALNYLPEDRAFSPHLTLGRVKSPANRDKLAHLLAKRLVDLTPLLGRLPTASRDFH